MKKQQKPIYQGSNNVKKGREPSRIDPTAANQPEANHSATHRDDDDHIHMPATLSSV